jgi:hypothetical protein
MASLFTKLRGWDVTVLAAVFVLALSASPLSAQRSGRGYFQAGMHEVDLDSLNNRLALFGIAPFEQRFLTLGGGGHFEIGRIMIGGEGHGMIEQEQTTGSFQRELAGGYGFFDVGVLLARETDVRAYVLAGIGGGGFELESTERALPTFDEALLNPPLGAEMSVSSFLVQAAVGADYIARFNGGGFRGISVGVRAGYTYAPSTDEWEVNDSDAPGGPELGVTGPYIRITVGGVGR